jgi:hypothetical protein
MKDLLLIWVIVGWIMAVAAGVAVLINWIWPVFLLPGERLWHAPVAVLVIWAGLPAILAVIVSPMLILGRGRSE